jgi:hypothetical protein
LLRQRCERAIERLFVVVGSVAVGADLAVEHHDATVEITVATQSLLASSSITIWLTGRACAEDLVVGQGLGPERVDLEA